MAALPFMAGSFTISLVNEIGMAALVVMGLVLLSGIGGVTSFGHAAFVGIAAYTTAWVNTELGLSPWIGLVLALAMTAGSALVIGALTLRLGGHYLPLSTIAWGLSVPLLFGNMTMLGRHSGISDIDPIALGGFDLMRPEFVFYLVWVLVAVTALFCHNLLNARMGRLIRAVRGGKILLASVGADIFRVRLALFVFSALTAAVAGWLYAHANRFVSPAPFSLHASIDYMFMMVVGGLGQLAGALAGATIVIAMKSALQDVLPLVTQHAAQIQSVVFASLFILLLHHARGGFMALAERFMQAGPAHGKAIEFPVEPLARRAMPERGTLLLSVENAVKRFKGLVAVNDVSFDVKAGEILAVIGPNGAGKSTMFNLLTGALDLSSGHVEFMGRDVTAMGQRQIALMGMARTFQHVKLRPQMNVLENVALGAHARGNCGYLRGGLNLDGDEERQIMAEAALQISRIGLAGQEHELAGNIPLGTQRLIEIGRALAADPVLMILDEPAAGLRKPEKQALAELLLKLRESGVTIMIVEHDMDFIMKLADRLVVMNFGHKLFEGRPEAARADQHVRAAYLGNAA
ncbi:ABC transporter permease subunit [Zhengella mangrovi]|nr:branched-chain amino acid ABC transporter ATP-binding protein/permease [Zhengella mangrovi]